MKRIKSIGVWRFLLELMLYELAIVIRKGRRIKSRSKHPMNILLKLFFRKLLL